MCATESDRDFLSSTDPRKKVAKKEDLVGVIGFEPTAPASRSHLDTYKYLFLLR